MKIIGTAGRDIRAARRESWSTYLSNRDEPAYTLAEMEPIALAIQDLVRRGATLEWVGPDEISVDGARCHVSLLPALAGAFWAVERKEVVAT